MHPGFDSSRLRSWALVWGMLALLVVGLGIERHFRSPEARSPAAAAPHLSDSDANRIGAYPHLLEFMSPNCAACARMLPVVAELERRCAANDGTIIQVNVEESRGESLAVRYGVRVLPTFISLDANGREVDRVVGEQTPEQLALVLRDVRGAACSAL